MNRRRAFALPIVLWAAGILAAALVTAAAFLDASLSSEATAAQTASARQLALSGLSFAVAANAGKFPATFTRTIAGQGSFTVERTSDSGRINLNELLKKKDIDAVTRVLTALGGDASKATLAARALKRRTWLTDDSSNTGFLPFESLDQLQNVPEFVDAMQKSPHWRQAVTLWGSGAIDLNFADAEMLTALGGVSAQQAANFVKARLGPDGVAGSKDDLNFGSIEQAATVLGLGAEATKHLGKYFGTKTELQRIKASATSGRLQRHVVVVIKAGEKNLTPVAWDEG